MRTCAGNGSVWKANARAASRPAGDRHALLINEAGSASRVRSWIGDLSFPGSWIGDLSFPGKPRTEST